MFLGGSGTHSFRPGQLFPVRGGDIMAPVLPPLAAAVETDTFGPPFGDDPKARADAAPINHVRRGLPPFLLMISENDLPTLPGMAEEFAKALRDAGSEARLLKMAQRNHSSVLFSAIRPDDPTARALLEFVR